MHLRLPLLYSRFVVDVNGKGRSTLETKNPQTLVGSGLSESIWMLLDYILVPEVGIEPTRSCPRWILSPVRLPVSPLRR